MMACGWGVQFFSIVKSAGAFTIINQILFILCIDVKDKMGTREVEELIAPGSLGSGFVWSLLHVRTAIARCGAGHQRPARASEAMTSRRSRQNRPGMVLAGA